MKLCLGSAQFGLAYGISNQLGQTSQQEVKAILAMAHAAKIKIIDTASTYGNCESVLGQCLTNKNTYKFITKIPPINSDVINTQQIQTSVDSVQESMQLLNTKSLHCLLLHNAIDLLKPGGDKLFSKLHDLKDKGMILKLGVSLYSNSPVIDLINNFDLDIVQVPFNIIDRTIITKGYLELFKQHDIEVQARSIFLQGLLLMNPKKRPTYFNKWSTKLNLFFDLCHMHKISPIEASLLFVNSFPEIDSLIIGVNNTKQLSEIIESYHSVNNIDENTLNISTFNVLSSDDQELINPSAWRV